MATDNPSGTLAAVCGVKAVVLNLAAVVALQAVPHCYKPGDIGGWLAESLAAPMATTVAAWCFTLGLAALVPFGVGLAQRDRGTAVGAALIAAGALLDAAGTMAPVAALHSARPVAEALLWMTLLLDSSFNALLGFGLLAVGWGMSEAAGWPRGLRGLAWVAGLASLPVALQFHSDFFANLLLVSGPLWIAWVLWASYALARGPRDEAAVPS